MQLPFAKVCYENQKNRVSCAGLVFCNGPDLENFMKASVAARFHDKVQKENYERFLRDLDLTKMGKSNLEAVILVAEEIEENNQLSWSIGESLAESLLIKTHEVIFPWNMKRDLRNPKASLSGADIVGFMPSEKGHFFVLGEVKTSSEDNHPPQVMRGDKGLTHQISKLANNLDVVSQLLGWLFVRVNNTEYEMAYKESYENFLNSENNTIKLFGILIRDTDPNELDLKSQADKLDSLLKQPVSCELIAVYLACRIEELPNQIKGSGKP